MPYKNKTGRRQIHLILALLLMTTLLLTVCGATLVRTTTLPPVLAQTTGTTPAEAEPTVEETAETTDITPEATATVTGTAEVTGTTAMTAAQTGPAVRVTNLLEYSVVNAQDETLAGIEDLILGLDSEQVQYAILSFGGFLDIGDKLVPIPVTRLTLGSEEELVQLDIDEERLEQAPGFDPDDWPDALTPGWDLEFRNYWDGAVTRTATITAEATTPVTTSTPAEPAIRVTELLGYSVINGELQDLGEIEDLVVDVDTMQTRYAVLSFEEGLFDFGEKLFAVPLDAFVLDPYRAAMVFDVEEAALENAPGFDSDTWPDTANPEWAIDSSNYWQDLGYIGPLTTGALGLPARVVGEPAIQLSELFDYRMITAQGDNFGQIEDFILGLNTGQIMYVVATFENLETGADQLYPIPITQLLIDPQQNGFILEVEADTLAEAPSFSAGTWPQMNTDQWDDLFREYWVATAIAFEPAVQATQLLEVTVADSEEGEQIGSFEDLFITFISKQITFAVLSLDNLTGDSANQLTVVPFNVLSLNLEDNLAIPSVSRTILAEAPTFTPDNWPDTARLYWDLPYLTYWETALLAPAAVEVTYTIIDESGLRASELLEYQVQNLDGENLGEVEDFMIDLRDAQISYAVLETGGFLDFGDTLLPIPVDALKLDSIREAFLLDVNEEMVENAPGFEGNDWPEPGDPNWDLEAREYWIDFLPEEETETAPQSDQAAPARMTLRLTDLLAYEVQTTQAETVGEIEELLLGLDSKQVNYAALSFDEFLNLEDAWLLVPLNVATLDYQDNSLTLDVDQATLQNAPTIDPENWPDTTSPQWDSEIRGYWQEEVATEEE